MEKRTRPTDLVSRSMQGMDQKASDEKPPLRLGAHSPRRGNGWRTSRKMRRMPYMQDVAKVFSIALARARERRDLTVEEVAADVAVDVERVRRWERGDALPDERERAGLERVLRVDLAKLAAQALGLPERED